MVLYSRPFVGWFVFWPILGFGNAQYQGPFGNPEAYQDHQQQHNQFDFEKEGFK